jgi:organic radical activating enzyme
MSKVHLPRVEFYITNVCNLTCDNCNRFNNYNFKGWQRWSDYKAAYTKWADLVTYDSVSILGGEPLLNPSLIDWAYGIYDLWQQPVEIVSNGYRDLLATKKAWLYISLHNTTDREKIYEEIRKFMPNAKKASATDPMRGLGDELFRDPSGARIAVRLENKFVTSSIKRDENNALTLYNSDPKKAHSVCTFVSSKNYHFIKGQLYKCGPVALLPEFDQQHPLAITDEERLLLNSYRPLTVENFEDYHKEFLISLENPIAQCKFCPAVHYGQIINPLRKGLKPS